MLTQEDRTKFIKRINAVELPDGTYARLPTKFVMGKLTKEQYYTERFKAKLGIFLVTALAESDEEIEEIYLDEAIARFEGEGGPCAA